MFNGVLYKAPAPGQILDVTCKHNSANMLTSQLTSTPREYWHYCNLRIVSSRVNLERGSAVSNPKRETHVCHGSLEMDLAIIAASLPSVMPLFKRLRHSRGTSQILHLNRVPTPKSKRAPRDPFRITGASSCHDVENQVESSKEYSSYDEGFKKSPYEGSDIILPLNVVELKIYDKS